MSDSSLIYHIGGGILGGLILNIMPCVLPGLFIKARGILEQLQREGSVEDQRADGMAYTFGCLCTFTVYAMIVIMMRMSGETLGWGMQMQSPIFVGGLLGVCFLFALYTFELFVIPTSIRTSEHSSPLVKSFFEGVFITLISTPCSAPILGGAVTVALASDSAWWETLTLFWSIAVGLALPILLISFSPGIGRWVPRHGMWMHHFKNFVAFTLLAACVWLLSIFQQLVTSDILWESCAGMAIISSFAIYRKAKLFGQPQKKLLISTLSPLVILALFALTREFGTLEHSIKGLYALSAMAGLYALSMIWREKNGLLAISLNFAALSLALGTTWWAATEAVEHIEWRDFESTLLKEHLATGAPAFVDFTADWCISCKTFERLYLNKPSTADDFRRLNVLPLKVDLTKPDSPLWSLLQHFKRSGIPAYVIYHADGTEELLPEGPPLSLHDRLVKLSAPIEGTPSSK